MYVITVISQSAQKRQRLYTNQHLENRTMNITVNGGQNLNVVDKFTYLESTLSRVVHIDDEDTARIAKASVSLGRLRANVWERNGIKLHTKLKVYKAVVLPTLLYACDTWTVYQRHAKRLNHFHLSCLRKLLKSSGKTDSRLRGPKESRDAKHAYCLKASTAKMDWSCYKDA